MKQKNYTSAGEGGLLIINDKNLIERAEIIREKGTNRSLYFRGMVDKYSWVDIGSSYLMNDMSAAYLWGQLKNVNKILKNRMRSWTSYYKELVTLKNIGIIELPTIPRKCSHNGHMFYIRVQNLKIRTEIINFLRDHDIRSTFHYVPLHTSKAGKRFGKLNGCDMHTTQESERLIRLPMYYGISKHNIKIVCKMIYRYYNIKDSEY